MRNNKPLSCRNIRKYVSIHDPTVSFQPYSVISALQCHFNNNSCQSIRLISMCDLTLVNLLLTIHEATLQTASLSRHKQRRFHVTNSVDFTSQTASLLLSTTVRRLLTPTLDHFHQRSTTPPFNTRHLLNQIANSPTISFSLFRFSRCRNKKSPILSMAPF